MSFTASSCSSRYNLRHTARRRSTQDSLVMGSEVMEAAGVANMPPQRPKESVSGLFDSIVRFWSLILKSPVWPLGLSPHEIAVYTITPSTSSEDEIGNHDLGGEGAGNENGQYNPEQAATQVPNDNLRNNVLARLILHEELDRLRLWKADFTETDMDELFDIDAPEWHAVLECLVNIAKVLTREYTGKFPSSPPPAIKSKLDDEKLAILGLVTHFEALLKRTTVEDTVMTEGSEGTESMISGMIPDGETFLNEVKEETNRLHRLSGGIRLLLMNSVNSSPVLTQNRCY